MLHKSLASLIVLPTFFFSLPQSAQAQAPVVRFLAEYLAGKLIDEVWDTATGKPDVALLDKRLKELESSALMRGEMQKEIQKLREGLHDRITRGEFRKMAEKTIDEIGSIKRRLDDLEERVEKLEVENRDLKDGTKNATDSQFFARRAGQFISENNMKRAIANSNIAIRLDPKNPMAFLVRAYVYQALGEPEIVIPDAAQAIKLGPKEAYSYAIRGKAYLDVGSRLDSRNGIVFGMITTAYKGRKEVGRDYYKKAIDDLTKAIELNPKLPDAYRTRGFVVLNDISRKFNKPHTDNALSDLTKAIELNPKDKEAYWLRGHLYGDIAVAGWFIGKYDPHTVERFNKAIDEFSKALDLDPKFAKASDSRAWATNKRDEITKLKKRGE